MTKQVQIRRGNTDACDNFIGAVGEICVDLGNAIDRSHTLRIHDNNKLGGWKLINENHLEDRLKLFVSELVSSDLYLKNASQTITGTVKINSADNQSALNIFYPYGNAEDIRFIAETSGKDSDGNPVVTRYPATAIRSSNSSGTNTTTIGNLIPNAYNNEETESPQFAFSGSLMIQTTSEGSKFFLSQNPSVDSNGFEIATTSWVRTNLENRIGTLFGLVDSLSGKVTNLNFLTEKTADDRYVKKTGGTIGGTMTGKLIFDFHGEEKTDRIVEGILTSEQTKEVNGVGESFYKEFGVVTPKTDANGKTSNKYVGVLRIGKRYINADTERNYTRLYAYNTSGVNSKDEHNFNALGIEYDERTESVRSYAPTPKEDSNTHEIATTKWVHDEIARRIDNLTKIPVGTEMNFYTATPPKGFLVCNGGEVSRTTYPDLFKAIGTTYGKGDGNTTFNLPDRIKYPYARGVVDTEKVKLVGKQFEPVLPNITGACSLQNCTSSSHYKSLTEDEAGILKKFGGAFNISSELTKDKYKIHAWSGTLETKQVYLETFDASRSNKIYNNDCNTVLPPSIGVLPCIKAFSEIINEDKLDVTKLANDVASLAILKNQTSYVIKEWYNERDWYRVWSNGFIEQGGYIVHGTYLVDNNKHMTTIPLLLPYANTDYHILTISETPKNYGSTGICSHWFPFKDFKTNTTFRLQTCNHYSGYYWETKGFGNLVELGIKD